MEQTDYERRIAAEGSFWDREFLEASRSEVFPCAFHASPYFQRRLTRRYLARIVEGLNAKSCVLDLGCGKGWLTRMLAATGAQAKGVDVAARCIEEGNRQARTEGLANCRFEQWDANVGELPESTYDLVVSWGALHHLVMLDHVAEQIARSLKPDGRFVLLECVDQKGWRGRLAGALADFFHLVLPTDRAFGAKFRHGLARLAGGNQEFKWSPFENAGGGVWREAVGRHFEVVEHEECFGFMSPFAGRVRLSGAMESVVLGGLFALDRTLVSLGLVPAEYHFMVLRRKE